MEVDGAEGCQYPPQVPSASRREWVLHIAQLHLSPREGPLCALIHIQEMRPQSGHEDPEQLEHTCAGLAWQLDAFGQPWWPSPDPGNSEDTAGKERTRTRGVRSSEGLPRQPRAVCSCQTASSPPFDPSLPRAPQWACYSGHRIGSVSSGGAGRGWDPVILPYCPLSLLYPQTPSVLSLCLPAGTQRRQGTPRASRAQR